MREAFVKQWTNVSDGDDERENFKQADNNKTFRRIGDRSPLE